MWEEHFIIIIMGRITGLVLVLVLSSKLKLFRYKNNNIIKKKKMKLPTGIINNKNNIIATDDE